MFKRSVLKRYLAAAAALAAASVLAFLPCASFISHAEAAEAIETEEEAEVTEEVVETEDAAPAEEPILAEETVRTKYFNEDGNLTGTGTAVFLFDQASGSIIGVDYYDEDGAFLFTVENDPEAAIVTKAVYNAVSKAKLDTLPGAPVEDDLTAADLAGEVVESMDNISSARYDSLTDMNCSISAMGMTLDLGMQIGIDMEAFVDPVMAHMIMDYNMDMMGEEMNEQMEVYTVAGEDENSFLTYTRTIADGDVSDWEMEEVSFEELPASADKIYNSIIFEKIRDGELEAILGPETVFVDDVECYVLSSTLTGDILKETSSYMMSGGQEDANIFGDVNVDWDAIEANITVYVNAEDKTLTAMALDCLPLASVLMQEAMGVDEETATIDIRFFDMVTRYTEYDIDPIEVPEFE